MRTPLDQAVLDENLVRLPIKSLVTGLEPRNDMSSMDMDRSRALLALLLSNPIEIFRREGVNYVTKGQQTVEMIAMLSGSRETLVQCVVIDDSGFMREADIFSDGFSIICV